MEGRKQRMSNQVSHLAPGSPMAGPGLCVRGGGRRTCTMAGPALRAVPAQPVPAQPCSASSPLPSTTKSLPCLLSSTQGFSLSMASAGAPTSSQPPGWRLARPTARFPLTQSAQNFIHLYPRCPLNADNFCRSSTSFLPPAARSCSASVPG